MPRKVSTTLHEVGGVHFDGGVCQIYDLSPYSDVSPGNTGRVLSRGVTANGREDRLSHKSGCPPARDDKVMSSQAQCYNVSFSQSDTSTS